MKYRILILGFFSVTSLMGQEPKKIKYQIDGGATFSIPHQKTIHQYETGYGTNSKEFTSSYSYFFEFMINFNLKKNISVISGLDFLQNKFDVKLNYGILSGNGVFTNSHLQIPVLINYRLKNKISISAGSYFSFLLQAKEVGELFMTQEYLVNGNQISQTSSIKLDSDLKEEYAKYDIGLSTQVNYEIPLIKGFSGIIFSRFNYGLIDQLINEKRHNSTDWTWKNINLIIGIGIRY